MASGALSQGRDNHRLNNLPKERSQFLCENILKSWSRIRKRGPYDLVILDPPSFQRGSFVASKDYARLVRRLPEMMPQGGQVLACLNAPELGEDFVRALFAELLPDSEFLERLPAHEDFPDVDPARQLKLMVFKLPALALD
jgi:23S rRNA (cytosine1962-C5)-methyltransferase